MSTLTPVEIFANNCSTTVAVGGYTAGSGVLNVASTTSPWPAISGSEQFHISVYRIESGIATVIVNFTVTAINSSTQFAVVAEGPDANALESDTVVGVLSAAGMTQIKQDTFQVNVNTASFSATPVFDLSQGDQFITLGGNVTSSTLSNLQAGRRVIFYIKQDATGGRSFAWPTNVKGGLVIDSTAIASTFAIQEFSSPDGSDLYAINPGVINLP